MATKESIKQEIDHLSDEEFQLVADFIEFIKLRNQKVAPTAKKRLSEFYGAFRANQPEADKEEMRKIVGESLAKNIINQQ
ncbi:MAG: hypothetical protein ACSI46_20110 [Gloeotrichia echinulata DVL01]|jgi:hypothetical protein|nr:hypothetical protein [Gloeotrichia echinulata DEX184]